MAGSGSYSPNPVSQLTKGNTRLITIKRGKVIHCGRCLEGSEWMGKGPSYSDLRLQTSSAWQGENHCGFLS